MYFDYQHLKFRYEPYPIGITKPLMEPALYQEFLDNFPTLEQFSRPEKLGLKYSLSERFNPADFKRFIRANPLWQNFNDWIKSPDFVRGVLGALAENNLDLGYDPDMTATRQMIKRLSHRGRVTCAIARLRSRFEFSMLPADGGHILPHSDSPNKIITLIVSMVDDDEWDPEFGGGTDINAFKDRNKAFNQTNRQAQFSEVDVVDTFEFTPNQAVIFIKTFNSWHSVRPMRGIGSSAMRRTLTINIEAFV